MEDFQFSFVLWIGAITDDRYQLLKINRFRVIFPFYWNHNRPGTIVQPPELLIVRYTNIWPNLICYNIGFKTNNWKSNFHNDYVTDFEVCRFHKNKIWISRISIFLQIKKLIHYTSRIISWQKKVLWRRVTVKLRTKRVNSRMCFENTILRNHCKLYSYPFTWSQIFLPFC